jgi:uncharacterized oligopeptide transporter (OPT) family protein
MEVPQSHESAPKGTIDLTQVPEDDRDRVWYENYYQGDNQPQLTVRAIVMGMALGGVMSLSNLYVGLKTGWGLGVAITACILSYALWQSFLKIGLAKTPMSMLENNCMQSTASSAGYSTGGTMTSAIAAYLIITGENMPFWVLFSWTAFLALLGVSIAVPMKRQMINREQLKFPSGIAAAETLRSLHAAGGDAILKARALFGTMALGVVIKWFVEGNALMMASLATRAQSGNWFTGWTVRPDFSLFGNLSIPYEVMLPITISGRKAEELGLALPVDPMMIAAGALVGMRTSVSMAVGAVIVWGILQPMLDTSGVLTEMKSADTEASLGEPLKVLQLPATDARVAADAALDTAVAALLALPAAEDATAAHRRGLAVYWAGLVNAGSDQARDSLALVGTTAAGLAALPPRDATAAGEGLAPVVTHAAAVLAADAAAADANTRLEYTLAALAADAPALAAATAVHDAAVTAADARAKDVVFAKKINGSGATLHKLSEAGVVPVTMIRKWALWTGSAMMVTAGLTAFAFQWRSIVRALSGITALFGKKDGAKDDPLAQIEVPNSWFIVGTVVSGIGCIAVMHSEWGIEWYWGVVSIAFAFVLSLVACRATGETDITPIGAMGKVTQLFYGVTIPQNATANLMTAGVTAGAAGAAADLLTDLKSGYLLGANPRKQFIAQALGIIAGTLIVVPVWYVLVPNAQAIGAESKNFPAPSAEVWASVAKLLANGLDSLHPTIQVGMVIGGILGVLFTVSEQLVPASVKTWIPSATGLGLACVINFSDSMAFLVGALIAWAYARRNAEGAERYVVPVSSGIIAGESIMGIVIALLGAAAIM